VLTVTWFDFQTLRTGIPAMMELGSSSAAELTVSLAPMTSTWKQKVRYKAKKHVVEAVIKSRKGKKIESKTMGGFHNAIYALRLKFAFCAHLFSLINHHVLAPYAQLFAFSPRFGWALCFTPCAQLL
jgi:hypothetical protein